MLEQVEVKIRLPDRAAYDKVASLLARSKKASYAQVLGGVHCFMSLMDCFPASAFAVGRGVGKAA